MADPANDLKVIHLWRRPGPSGGGGGGVYMDLLHRSLLERGVDSTLFCIDNPSARPDIREVPRWPLTEGMLRLVSRSLGLNDIHRVSSWLLPRDEVFRQADVIHIHGLHSGFLSYLALPRLTRDKPAVFTLQDQWPMTGHCAYSFDCERWKIGCGSCPYPDAYPKIRRDATRLELRLKERAYENSNIVFVAQNAVQMQDVQQSILAPFKKALIPLSVDTRVFRPVDRSTARRSLGVDQHGLVVMFTATDVMNVRKGGHHLLEALGALPRDLRSQASLLAVGRNSENLVDMSPIPGVALPFADDPHEINLAYNAADVLAFPSSQETFGLVWAEALAAGTPVVSFAVGGAPDHLTSDKTGVVVAPGDVDGLAEGINRILGESDRDRSMMRASSREYAVSELSLGVGTERYVELYRSLL